MEVSPQKEIALLSHRLCKNQPATIFPRLSAKVDIIRVRRQGKDDTDKDFRVGSHRVEGALRWLKDKNPAYGDAQGTLPLNEFFRDDSC